jgi:hypothetical protein
MGVDLLERLGDLEALCDELSSLDATVVPASVRSEALVSFERCSSRFEAARLVLTGAWDASADWALDGALGGAAWLRARTAAGTYASYEQVRLARFLRGAVVVREAFLAGRLTYGKVRRLAPLADGDTAGLFARDEEELVAQACRLTDDAVGKLVRYWQALADDELSRPDQTAEALEETQSLRVHATAEGAVEADLRLGPAGGAIWRSELERLIEEKWRASSDQERLDTTPAQRAAAAQVEMARRAAEWTAAMTGKSVPLFVGVLDLDVLEGRVGRRCHIEGTGRISPQAAREWLAGADFAPLIVSPNGAVLHFGRTRRLATAKQRLAAMIRDQHCAFPGCDRPAGWSDVHHLVEWDAGGPTDIDNLALLCKRHHHQVVHAQGFTPERHADGTLTWHRPDGTAIPEPYRDWPSAPPTSTERPTGHEPP